MQIRGGEYPSGRLVLIGMNPIANQTELVFEIAWVTANEGSAENNQARSEFGSADRLFGRKTANRLDGHLHRRDDFSQLIERTGIWVTHCGKAAAFIVADMVNDEIAAKILQPFCGCDPVFGSDIVTHDLHTQILCGVHHGLDGLWMSTLHDYDMGCARACCDLSLKPAAIHAFEIGHDGNAGKLSAQSTDAVHSFRNDEGSTCLQPVDSCTDGKPRGFESFGGWR